MTVLPPLMCLSPDATATVAQTLGATLVAGDVILLEGPVGAGKSHFARAVIQSRLAALNRSEDVPSPTFTIVQCYDLDGVELWHADLYRLQGPSDCDELGLTEAFDDAICLIEWPDRLGNLAPRDALIVRIEPQGEVRLLRFHSDTPAWSGRLARIGLT